jgi:dynein heavy chain
MKLKTQNLGNGLKAHCK